VRFFIDLVLIVFWRPLSLRVIRKGGGCWREINEVVSGEDALFLTSCVKEEV
jgi:hypothetical protein